MPEILHRGWVVFAIAGVCIMGTVEAGDYPLGCLPEEQPGPPLSEPGGTVAGQVVLPPAVDHTAAMPPVKSQGSQGSCVAWSVGYAIKSYLEGQEHGWSLSDPAHQVSPAFLYNQTNGGRDQGTYVSHAYWLLSERGAASLAAMPYDPSDCLTWPSAAACEGAHAQRSSTWSSLGKSDIESIKQQLFNGYVLQLTLEVDRAWDTLGAGTNYVWYPDRQSIRGSHSVCIVGYDDERSGAGHVGAFKIQNSWGTGWGAAGYCWAAYEAMSTAGVLSVTRLTDRIDHQPSAKVRLTVEHPFRGRLRITVGAGPVGSPVYSETFYDYGYTYQGSAYDSHPNIATVMDVSGGTTYLNSHPWWVKIYDGYADSNVGVVTQLQLEYGSTVRAGVSIPATLQDSGSSYVYISDVPGDGPTPTWTATKTPTATPTATPTGTVTSTATPTWTSTAALAPLSGTVRFRGRSDYQETVTVTLQNLSTGISVAHTVLTDPSGNFRLESIEPGVYESTAEARYYLRTAVPDVVVGQDGGFVDFGTMAAGDFNCDNEVDFLDVAMLSASYGSLSGEPAYRPACDVNRNGEIDSLDIAPVSHCYGAEGAAALQ